MLWSSAQLSVVEKAHLYSPALVMHQPVTHWFLGAVPLPWAGYLGRADGEQDEGDTVPSQKGLEVTSSPWELLNTVVCSEAARARA